MSILDLLRRAQEEIVVTLEREGKTFVVTMDGPPQSIGRLHGINVIGELVNKARWETAATAFQAVQGWIEAHWEAGRVTTPPEGTVIIDQGYGPHGEEQLAASTAAKRLIVAASLYGAEAVAKCATEFAAHGLIEARSIHLLKGPSISQEIRLDEHCTLLPYREALRRISEANTWHDLEGMRWPSEQDDSVCALECRRFECRSLWGDKNEHYGSPLTKLGPEILPLMLGLVWGNGLRQLGHWHFVPAPIGEALPFRYGPFGGGGGSQRVELPLRGYGPGDKLRPVPGRGACGADGRLCEAARAIPTGSGTGDAALARQRREGTLGRQGHRHVHRAGESVHWRT